MTSAGRRRPTTGQNQQPEGSDLQRVLSAFGLGLGVERQEDGAVEELSPSNNNDEMRTGGRPGTDQSRGSGSDRTPGTDSLRPISTTSTDRRPSGSSGSDSSSSLGGVSPLATSSRRSLSSGSTAPSSRSTSFSSYDMSKPRMSAVAYSPAPSPTEVSSAARPAATAELFSANDLPRALTDSPAGMQHSSLPPLKTSGHSSMPLPMTQQPQKSPYAGMSTSGLLGAASSAPEDRLADRRASASAAMGQVSSFSPPLQASPSAVSEGMSRSSSGQSATYFPPSTARSTSSRPGSSSSSSRPWVRDSDCSSICSAASMRSSFSVRSRGKGSFCASGAELPEPVGERDEDEVDELEDGEVYRVVEGDRDDFLDPRPEPAGAALRIDRETDPRFIILIVSLPGFTLENVTVAVRKNRRVHIVADQYGENGGHFEKLVALGRSVTTDQPRADFNGTDLRVYLRRRPRPKAPTAPPIESLLSSPPTDSERFSRGSLDSSNGSSSPSSIDSSSTAPSSVSPPSTAIAGEIRKQPSKSCMVGPEGARQMAKEARAEAERKATADAKRLACGGLKKAPFRDGAASLPSAAPTASLRAGSSPSSSKSSTPTPSARPKLPHTGTILPTTTEGDDADRTASSSDGGITPRAERDFAFSSIAASAASR